MFEIGINLRVTESLNQGMRGYMEDCATYYFEKSQEKPDSFRIKFAYFGVFDGHGGAEAAKFAKANLLNEIKKIDGFWSTDDNVVLEAIKQGFINTHKAMWNERRNWTKTARGLESTAGTTASIAIVRDRKLYTGHVGDSAIVLGYRDTRDQSRDLWHAQPLTVEHKPTNPKERERIERAGGSLMRKAGVYRIVWKRPALPETPASKQPQQFESVPFLAVARSLGDLWSYDKESDQFHVSPEPDVQCISLDHTKHKCLILGSDGLWNMLAPDSAVEMVRVCERATELKVFTDPDVPPNFFYNPSGSLVQLAIHRWMRAGLRADNVTALVVMLDPPGRPMSQLRGEQRDLTLGRLGLQRDGTVELVGSLDPPPATGAAAPPPLRLSDLLVECDKWQNANRPAKAAAPPAASPTPQPPPPTAKALTGQPAIHPDGSSDRTLFSPGFSASTSGGGGKRPLPALEAAPDHPPVVSFYLPAAADSSDAPPPPPARSPATPLLPSQLLPPGTGSARRQTRSAVKNSLLEEVAAASTRSAAAVKRRRMSAVPAAASTGAALAKRLRSRRKTTVR